MERDSYWTRCTIPPVGMPIEKMRNQDSALYVSTSMGRRKTIKTGVQAGTLSELVREKQIPMSSWCLGSMGRLYMFLMGHSCCFDKPRVTHIFYSANRFSWTPPSSGSSDNKNPLTGFILLMPIVFGRNPPCCPSRILSTPWMSTDASNG